MNILCENDKNYKTLAGWLKGGRFPHAILIAGPKGTGRTTLAKYIAQTLLCSGEDSPCQGCAHCLKIKKAIHPDFLLFSGEGGSRSFHISQVREIRSEAWVSSNDGKAKVFLLSNAEEMSVQAQNALLKIIEEPPEDVYFILTCENQNQMLATIRSRAAVLITQVVDVDNVIQVLRERLPHYSEEEYQSVALMSGGNIGKALAYINEEDSQKPYELANNIWENIKNDNELEAMIILSKFERDKQGFLLQLGLIKSLVSEQLRKGEKKSSKEPSALQLSKIIDIIENITIAVNGNVNMLLLTTIFSAKISKVLTTKSFY